MLFLMHCVLFTLQYCTCPMKKTAVCSPKESASRVFHFFGPLDRSKRRAPGRGWSPCRCRSSPNPRSPTGLTRHIDLGRRWKVNGAVGDGVWCSKVNGRRSMVGRNNMSRRSSFVLFSIAYIYILLYIIYTVYYTYICIQVGSNSRPEMFNKLMCSWYFCLSFSASCCWLVIQTNNCMHCMMQFLQQLAAPEPASPSAC